MYSKKLGSLFMSKQQELLERIQAEFQPHFATVALALHLYTKSEWESLGEAFPKSPNCLGVGQ